MKKQMSGFSLMEILIALVIIGILGAIVVQNFGKKIDDARMTKMKSDFKAFESALLLYYSDNGTYPTTEQGLEALEQRPELNPVPSNYPRGGYLKVQKDPWKSDYLYLSPPEYGSGDYEIVSLGADKQEGGEGRNTDFFNWNIDDVLEELEQAENP